MIPNTSVRPAESRNSRMPNWSPLRSCVAKRLQVMECEEAGRGKGEGQKRKREKGRGKPPHPDPLPRYGREGVREARFSRFPLPFSRPSSLPVSSLQRTLLVIGVFVILQRRRDGLQRYPAFRVLGDLEDMHILDREVVVAELEAAAQGLEVGALQRGHERLLVGDVPFHLRDRRVEE